MIPGLVQRRRLANPRSTAAAAALNPAFAVTTPRRPAQAENEREKESKNLRNKAAKYNIINKSASKIGQNRAKRSHKNQDPACPKSFRMDQSAAAWLC
jgi:hypothetical protein